MELNWRTKKYISMTLLGISILALLGISEFLGIEHLTDKVFNTLTWSQIIAIGLGYVMWVFNSLVRG